MLALAALLLNASFPSLQAGSDGPATLAFRATDPAAVDSDFDASSWWKPVCSGSGAVDAGVLEDVARRHRELFAGPVVVIDSAPRSPGSALNVVLNVAGTPPAGAVAALTAVESAIESTFTDPVTVEIDVSFQVLAPGMLGATNPMVGSRPWPNARKKLRDDADSGIVPDVIQQWLPNGTGFRVNYNQITLVPFQFKLWFFRRSGFLGSAPLEDTLFLTKANAKAVGYPFVGLDANITFNSAFAFDFDPSDGVDPGKHSFQDVAIHEIGHVLGFISAGDFNTPIQDSAALDLFRFRATDGGLFFDLDPDTYKEFSTYPRLLARDLPNDDHALDFITAEYRMSDGNPYQMSHFREQTPSIGLMDPAFAAGETFYPTFFQASDLAAFDAIGWDY